jgi:hypothetical protein
VLYIYIDTTKYIRKMKALISDGAKHIFFVIHLDNVERFFSSLNSMKPFIIFYLNR